jgi:hypothetical protein
MLEAAAAEHVDAGGRFRHHRRWAQRQVGDVGKDAHPRRAGGDHAHKYPGVDVAALVGVILNADQVKAPGLDLAGGVEQRVGSVGHQEVSERQVAAVFGHGLTLCLDHRRFTTKLSKTGNPTPAA